MYNLIEFIIIIHKPHEVYDNIIEIGQLQMMLVLLMILLLMIIVTCLNLNKKLIIQTGDDGTIGVEIMAPSK